VKKKPIIIFKKPTDSIRFWFYKLEPKKTEPNRTQTEKNRAKYKKPSQTGKKPSQTRKNLAGLFEPVFS
jgi:hypothetical protein